MDNKYALGSTKVATEHHEQHQKAAHMVCRFCNSEELVFSPSMHDHRCAQCGEWQNDVSKGYATGRSNDY